MCRFEDSLVDFAGNLGCVFGGQRQGHQNRGRRRSHRRDVTEVDRHGFETNVAQRLIFRSEIDAVENLIRARDLTKLRLVGGDGSRPIDHRRIVANADRYLRQLASSTAKVGEKGLFHSEFQLLCQG